MLLKGVFINCTESSDIPAFVKDVVTFAGFVVMIRTLHSLTACLTISFKIVDCPAQVMINAWTCSHSAIVLTGPGGGEGMMRNEEDIF